MSKSNQSPTTPTRSAQHDALDVFLGEWEADGQAFGASSQDPVNPRNKPTPWTSTHSAQWHTGQFFLVQDERAQVAGPFDTLYILGWDDDAGRYFANTFENHGYRRLYEVTRASRVWTFNGETERARIEFSENGRQQTIAWEWRPKETWLPLCDRIATKISR
jgi:hypothetical protein